MAKTALIFGVTGQDGSYLCELLLAKEYRVHGVARRSSVDNRARLHALTDRITLHDGDMADTGSIWRIIAQTRPDEIYNLAAQTHVAVSFAEPEHTGDINGLGVTRLLEAIRTLAPQARFYQASTSELFGQGVAQDSALSEASPMLPASPYGAAKLYAFNMVRIYRQAYGLFACNGILFNHESPRRGADFVTAKIGRFAKSLKDGSWDGQPLRLGNLDAMRDWGHARDYVDGMWRMLQADRPDDFVLATGVARSVRDFVKAALPDLTWSGQGKNEIATLKDGRIVVSVDERLFRAIEVPALRGDSAKARAALGWIPGTDFDALVFEMTAMKSPDRAAL